MNIILHIFVVYCMISVCQNGKTHNKQLQITPLQNRMHQTIWPNYWQRPLARMKIFCMKFRRSSPKSQMVTFSSNPCSVLPNYLLLWFFLFIRQSARNTFVNTCIIVFFFQKSFSVKAVNVSYAWMVTRMLWGSDMRKKPSPPIVIKKYFC